MNKLIGCLLQFTASFDWSAVTPILAIIISIFALLINTKNARKIIRLSIQQAIFKTVSEKAKDCNTIWENEYNTDRGGTNPRYKIISEIIISKEVIEKSFYLFKKNYESIEGYKDDYYYLFWKQLRTDLRQFIRASGIYITEINEEPYSQQIKEIHFIFEKYFENYS